MLFGNEFHRDLAACRVNPLFLHRLCGILKTMVVFVVLGGEETVVTSGGYCRCIEMSEMVVGNGGVGIRPRKGLHP